MCASSIVFSYLSICLSIYPSLHIDVFSFFGRPDSWLFSFHLSICLSVYPSLHLSICFSIHLSVNLFICSSICPTVCVFPPSVHLFSWLFKCSSVSNYLYLPICLSIHQSSHLSICPLAPPSLNSYVRLSFFLSVQLTGAVICCQNYTFSP